MRRQLMVVKYPDSFLLTFNLSTVVLTDDKFLVSPYHFHSISARNDLILLPVIILTQLKIIRQLAEWTINEETVFLIRSKILRKSSEKVFLKTTVVTSMRCSYRALDTYLTWTSQVRVFLILKRKVSNQLGFRKVSCFLVFFFYRTPHTKRRSKFMDSPCYNVTCSIKIQFPKLISKLDYTNFRPRADTSLVLQFQRLRLRMRLPLPRFDQIKQVYRLLTGQSFPVI